MTTQRKEIVVVGGGPVGACAALALAAAGARVALLEKETDICPVSGGAFANCGLLVPSHIEPLAAPGALGRGLRWMVDEASPFYVAPRFSRDLFRWLWLFRAAANPRRVNAAAPLLRALHVLSAQLHDDLALRGGDGWLFHHDGVLQVFEARSAMEAAVRLADWSERLGVAVEIANGEDTGRRFSVVSRPIAGALFFPEDGHMDPARFTRAVADRAAVAGAAIRRGVEVIGLDSAPDGVRVVTTRGDVLADQVVLAAGAWTPSLTASIGLALPIQPAKGYSVDVQRPPDFPEIPLHLGDAGVVLTPLGQALRLGSTLELSGWDMHVRRARVMGLRRAAERVTGIPSSAPVQQVWRGPRPLTPDGLPVIGRVPRRERVILATGHCMLGLSLAPVTGRLVAELASGAHPSLNIAALSPSRFA